MRTELELVAESYLAAKKESYTKNPAADFIRHDVPAAVVSALGLEADGLIVKGSAGLGQWTDSPWIAILDPLVTTSTQRGYYIAYLFASSMNRIVLSLQQGITDLRDGLGAAEAKERLRHGGSLIRLTIPEFQSRFVETLIDLDSVGGSSRSSHYEAAHAFGRLYEGTLPTEEELVADLKNMVQLYRLLTYRGGPTSGEDEERPQFTDEQSEGIEDLRRYRFHRRIERNRRLALEVKREHGFICEACDFDFGQFYGDFAKNYIEAHHLTPLAELPKDSPVKLNAKTDFAVLCANCHRMIHWTSILLSVEQLRDAIKRQVTLA